MYHWGLEKELQTFLGQSQLGAICGLNNGDYIVCSSTKTLFVSQNQIAYTSPRLYTGLVFAGYLDMIFAVTTGVPRIDAFQPRNPKDFYMKDFTLDQQHVHQLYYDKTASSLITVGETIKIWKISRNPKVSSAETRYLLTLTAQLPTSTFIRNLHEVFIDEPRSRILVPSLHGYTVYEYNGRVYADVPEMSPDAFNAVALTNVSLKHEIENDKDEKMVPLNMFKRFFAADTDGNLRLWHKCGKLLHQFDTAIQSIIFAEFISPEFVLIVERNGKVLIVDIKTYRTVVVEEIGRKPDSIRLLRDPDRLAVACVNEFFIYRIRTLWELWYRPTSLAYSMDRFTSPDYYSRIGVFCDDGFFRLISPKNRLLIAAAAVNKCLDPLWVGYDRRCQEDFCLMVLNDHSIQFFEIKDEDFEPIDKVKVHSQIAFFAKALDPLRWIVFSIGPSSDIEILEWETWARVKRLVVDNSLTKFAFWDKFHNTAIIITERKLVIVSLQQLKINFKDNFRCPKFATFESGLLMVAHTDGSSTIYEMGENNYSIVSELKFGKKLTYLHLQYGLHIIAFEDKSVVIGDRVNYSIVNFTLPYVVNAACFLNMELDLLLAVQKEIMVIKTSNYTSKLRPISLPIDEFEGRKTDPRVIIKELGKSQYKSSNGGNIYRPRKYRTKEFKTVTQFTPKKAGEEDDDLYANFDYYLKYKLDKENRISTPTQARPESLNMSGIEIPVRQPQTPKSERRPVKVLAGTIRSGQKPPRFSYTKHGMVIEDVPMEEEDMEEEEKENWLEIGVLKLDKETQTILSAIEAMKAREAEARRKALYELMMSSRRSSNRSSRISSKSGGSSMRDIGTSRNDGRRHGDDGEYEYEYDEDGNRIGKHRKNNGDDEYEYEYDENGNRIGKRRKGKGGDNDEYEYEYDENGNRIGKRRKRKGGDDDDEYEYEYDENGNRIGKRRKRKGGNDDDEYEYEYDENGNRIGKHHKGKGGKGGKGNKGKGSKKGKGKGFDDNDMGRKGKGSSSRKGGGKKKGKGGTKSGKGGKGYGGSGMSALSGAGADGINSSGASGSGIGGRGGAGAYGGSDAINAGGFGKNGNGSGLSGKGVGSDGMGIISGGQRGLDNSKGAGGSSIDGSLYGDGMNSSDALGDKNRPDKNSSLNGSDSSFGADGKPGHDRFQLPSRIYRQVVDYGSDSKDQSGSPISPHVHKFGDSEHPPSCQCPECLSRRMRGNRTMEAGTQSLVSPGNDSDEYYTKIGDMFETPNNKYNFLPVTPPRTPRRRKLPLVMPPERLAILPSRKTNPYRPTIPVLNIPPPSNGGQALLPISQIPMYDLSSGFIGYSDSPPGSPRSEERTYSYNPKMQNSFTSSSRKSPRIKDINKDVSYHSSERRPLSEKALPPLQKL